jgi:cyclopropane fatty-acyl-phospholipid synthase-like methyltransferase
MTTALRAGTNTALTGYAGDESTIYGRLAHSPEQQAVFQAAMAAFTRCTLPGLLDHADLSSVRHLLDVGGGDGTTAISLSERYPDLLVTIFDMPGLATPGGDTASACFGDRVRFQTGDLFEDEFRRDVETILFSHVLEIFSAERIVTLLTKAYHALPACGRVFVYGFNVSDDETTGIFSARLSLYLNVLASGQGMAYPARDYEDWMRRAGFEEVHTIGGLPFEHGLVTGTKA